MFLKRLYIIIHLFSDDKTFKTNGFDSDPFANQEAFDNDPFSKQSAFPTDPFGASQQNDPFGDKSVTNKADVIIHYSYLSSNL